MPAEQPKPPDDELTRRLRDEVRKRRTPVWFGVLLALLLCGGPLVLLAWLAVPRRPPPAIVIVAFDDVAPLGTEVQLRAQVVDDESKLPLAEAGIELLFEEGKARAPGKSPPQKRTSTDESGTASLKWQFTAVLERAPVEFAVGYAGSDKRKSTGDRAHIYFYPAKSSLLFVGIETLVAASAKEWRERNVLEIQPLDKCGPILKELAQKRRIVYLAGEASDPWMYRRIRSWLADKSNRGTLPAGPLLGRESQASIAGRLNAIFKERPAAIIGAAKAAASLQAEGIETLLLDKGEAPKGVVPCKTWEQVPTLLGPTMP